MIIRKPSDLPYSQVTPKQVYVNRRRFLGAAPIALGALLGSRAAQATTKLAGVTKSSYTVDDKVTPLDVITHYNNFYEFGTDKEDPSRNAQNFRTSPWMVKIEGEVVKPKVLDLDALMKLAPLEERIYRHRCVEAWSIVVPWIGYPLNALLKEVEPTSKAKFVAFESYYDRKQMPQGTWAGLQFPYVEGLRLDEAMNPLALLAVGLYGETLPPQDGAPVDGGNGVDSGIGMDAGRAGRGLGTLQRLAGDGPQDRRTRRDRASATTTVRGLRRCGSDNISTIRSRRQ